MQGAINKLTIKGFKSIQELVEFELNDLNVIIGANGAGKSNFIEIFRMLMAMTQGNFSKFILERGGADNFLFNGPKVTPIINIEFEFNSRSSYSQGSNHYRFELTPTVDEKFLISEERKYVTPSWRPYGSAAEESRLHDGWDEKSLDGQRAGIGYYVYQSISNWMVYHFHDTSSYAPMRRSEIIEDSRRLQGNAANIAPLLSALKEIDTRYYNKIVNAIRLVMPFFDDFQFDIQNFGKAEKVKLTWKQKGSDFPMQPYHLSDGSIRFICLATALLQPNPPSTIIIDEPELGLHPAAIVILAELIQMAAQRTQVIVATQSPALIDQFAIADIIVINRKDGASNFERLTEENFAEWLKRLFSGRTLDKKCDCRRPSI